MSVTPELRVTVLLRDRQCFVSRLDRASVVRDSGYRLAFASQDGCGPSLVPWDELDVFFVGGSNQWKFCDVNLALVREAQERGKRVHFGRVNTLRRLNAVVSVGGDTVDGTFLRRAPNFNLPRLLSFLDRVEGQIGLFDLPTWAGASAAR